MKKEDAVEETVFLEQTRAIRTCGFIHRNGLTLFLYTFSQKGPDQLCPADCSTTTMATGAVKLKIDERGMSSIPPLSVPTLLQRTVARHMDHPAMCVKRDGKVYETLILSLV